MEFEIITLVIFILCFLFDLELGGHKEEGFDRLLKKYIYRFILVELLVMGWGLSSHFIHIARNGGSDIFWAYSSVVSGAPLIVFSVGFLIDYYFVEVDRKLYLREYHSPPVTRPLGLLMMLAFGILTVATGISQIRTAYF